MDQRRDHSRAGQNHSDTGQDQPGRVLAELLRCDKPGKDQESDKRDEPADQIAAADADQHHEAEPP